MRNATAGFALENARTTPMPIMEAIKPVEASAKGNDINAARPCYTLSPGAISPIATAARVDAMAIEAIIEPQ